MKKLVSKFINTDFDLEGVETIYANNKPFPHIGLSNLFNQEIIRQCAKEAEEVKVWYEKDNENAKKFFQNEPKHLGKTINEMLVYLNTEEFRNFLSELSGVKNLLPDDGSFNGLTKITKGGFLDVHIDFNQHKYNKSWRRVNLLLYLNYDWKFEYGGALGMWDDKGLVVEYLPEANMTAIFTCSENSFHGHPVPLNCPENRARYAINSYYYTQENPYGANINIHSTVYKPK